MSPNNDNDQIRFSDLNLLVQKALEAKKKIAAVVESTGEDTKQKVVRQEEKAQSGLTKSQEAYVKARRKISKQNY